MNAEEKPRYSDLMEHYESGTAINELVCSGSKSEKKSKGKATEGGAGTPTSSVVAD